jgi:hypothetical protein
MRYLVIAFVIGCGGSQAEAPKPAPPPATSHAGEDCSVLRERVTTAFVRLQAINAKAEVTSPHYQALGDVMDKLAHDLDRPFADGSVGALASDYKEAARAAGAATHDVATLLEQGEAALAVVQKPDGVMTRFGQQVKRVADDCRGGTAADCARVVEIIRGLDNGSPTSAGIQKAVADLGGVKLTTKGLKEHVAEAASSLTEIQNALAKAEQMQNDARAKINAYERAAAAFAGLNQRGDQLCAK